ncbi:MAG: alpha-L-fucosidase C-terminal domain-containing protein, partial [Opitutaceae bacterium]
FTAKGNALYAIVVGAYPDRQVMLTSMASSLLEGTVTSVSLLGSNEAVNFTSDARGLRVRFPPVAPCEHAYTLKIMGLKMNPSLNTRDGNPPAESP